MEGTVKESEIKAHAERVLKEAYLCMPHKGKDGKFSFIMHPQRTLAEMAKCAPLPHEETKIVIRCDVKDKKIWKIQYKSNVCLLRTKKDVCDPTQLMIDSKDRIDIIDNVNLK